jgi:autophagy-related protein 2
MLNDLWTPDVKATQLVDVISGVAPIRSVVNVGSGVADLVLLPIAQYKKDGRIVRGLQKGAKAFMKSTGMEALKLGARLATGTQVILEQAEDLLGAQFKEAVTAEALHIEPFAVPRGDADAEDPEEEHDLYSRYAEQPLDAKQGIQSAYTSLKRNMNTAAQTILAVPMEVYERSGHEVRSSGLRETRSLIYVVDTGSGSRCREGSAHRSSQAHDRRKRGCEQNAAWYSQYL